MDSNLLKYYKKSQIFSNRQGFVLNCSYNDILVYLEEMEIKIDLIIADPPYNISRKNNFKTLGRAGIDFGKWDKDFDQSDWINKLSKFVSPNGSILVFNDWKNFTTIVNSLRANGFVEKDVIRWIKKSPMPRNTNRRYVTDYEFIIWAVRDNKKRWIFNKNENQKYARPEYFFSSPMGKNKRLHPTQKPVSLIEELILVHSKENSIILDPFMGSGTTFEACQKTKRFCIGSEINKGYFEIIKKRFVVKRNENK